MEDMTINYKFINDQFTGRASQNFQMSSQVNSTTTFYFSKQGARSSASRLT